MNISMAVWGWPQWTLFVLMIISLFAAAALHGKPREGEYNAFLGWFKAGLIFFVLVCGGFYS